MAEASLNQQLVTIREAADLLAERYSMIGDLLREASETMAAALQSPQSRGFPEPLRTHIASLSTELTADGSVTAMVDRLKSFEASAVIGRILDLGEEARAVLKPDAD